MRKTNPFLKWTRLELRQFAKQLGITMPQEIERKRREGIAAYVHQKVCIMFPLKKRVGQKVDTSFSEGRSIRASWYFLFEENEKAFKEGRYPDILTDAQIISKMRSFFPSRSPVAFNRVSIHRAKFNRTRPKDVVMRSYKYIRLESGEVIRIFPRAGR